MPSILDITIDQLAQACRELSPIEKIELLERLPKNWFVEIDYQISDNQKRALDTATAKEESGESTWHSWDEVKRFVKVGDL